MMRRIISAVVVASVMAAMMLAMAMPTFAKSGVTQATEAGFGPKQGFNFGQCKKEAPEVGPGNGRTTATTNPSFEGGEDDDEGIGTTTILCRK